MEIYIQKCKPSYYSFLYGKKKNTNNRLITSGVHEQLRAHVQLEHHGHNLRPVNLKTMELQETILLTYMNSIPEFIVKVLNASRQAKMCI